VTESTVVIGLLLSIIGLFVTLFLYLIKVEHRLTLIESTIETLIKLLSNALNIEEES